MKTLIPKAIRAVAFAGLAAASLAGFAAPAARSQDKATPLSKVERLNRAPVNKEALQLQLPRPVVATLPNGLTLVLLEDHKLPTVAFTLWIRPGQLADPADLPGLATFTAAMLREGTARRTSLQIAAEADSLGITLAANSQFGESFTTVNASGLIDNTSQILDLLSDVVLHPSFPADELASYKQREGAALEERLSNPGFLAQQAFRRAVYGSGPLAISSPTKESLAAVTPDDLKRFHDQHFRPGNTILGVTGDFKAGEMRALLEKTWGGWTGAAEPSPALGPEMAAQPARIVLVDRPGSVQTYIIGGDKGIRRTDPDYFRLVVMNRILGGGAQARLFLDLREEHGYTYGVYSNFSAATYPGDWAASGSVRTPVTDGSMTQLIYEFKRINSEPVPQNELDDAHHAIISGFALSLEQPGQVLNDWMTVQYYGLPFDYWDKYADRIAGVDAAAVQAAANKFIDLEHMQWVCVGDRKQIQEVLQKYGPVSVVDVEGKPQQ
jgi:zinc protease